MATALACTVRDCGLPLDRHDRAYVCARGHSYDVARGGYVNLLQPTDRHSLTAGDSAAAVEARARLLAGGVGSRLLAEMVQYLSSVTQASGQMIADLGSGSGDALAACTLALGSPGIGVDLSVAAVRHAARRFPHLTWVVANADRRLPLVSNHVAVVLSVHGRRNPAETSRALTAAGVLLVAVPAADDLSELRTALQGRASQRSRVEDLISEHSEFFTELERFSIREQHTLDRDRLLDVLQSTYRGARTSVKSQVEKLTAMDVTFASDCVLFRKTRGGRPLL